MPPAPTITERTPPAKRMPPVTSKERTMHIRDPRSGGVQGVDGRYNARRSGAPEPHAHGNVARQVVDDRRAEVRGENRQKTPTATSTAPVHQRLGSATAETTPSGAQAAAADKTQRLAAACEGKNR